jgi:hypothetical protein
MITQASIPSKTSVLFMGILNYLRPDELCEEPELLDLPEEELPPEDPDLLLPELYDEPEELLGRL